MTAKYLIICSALIWSNPLTTKCQDAYEARYFELLDYMLAYPYDFLGKTTFQISSMQEPPVNVPVTKSYWHVSVRANPNDPNDKIAEIETGYSPIYVSFSKPGIAYSIAYMQSMAIEFAKLKEHLEKKAIVLNQSGYSKVFSDALKRGHFVIQLELLNDIAVVNIIAVDPTTGKIKG